MAKKKRGDVWCEFAGPETEWCLFKIRGGNVLEVWVWLRLVPVPVCSEKERRAEL